MYEVTPLEELRGDVTAGPMASVLQVIAQPPDSFACPWGTERDWTTSRHQMMGDAELRDGPREC